MQDELLIKLDDNRLFIEINKFKPNTVHLHMLTD